MDENKWRGYFYYSKPVAPYSSDNIFFTQSKDGQKIERISIYPQNMNVTLPSRIKISQVNATKKTKIVLLGSKEKLKWKQEGKVLLLQFLLQCKIK